MEQSARPKVFDIELLGDSHELVYYPGSTIEGNVVIELTTPLRPIQGIKVVLGGIVFTNWEQRKETHGTVYKITFSEEETALDDITVEVSIRRDHTAVDAAPQQLVGLPTGKHTFPFTIQLSPDLTLPSSFESPFGYIRYTLTAGICTPELRQFYYTSAVKPVPICSNIDVNLPTYTLPITKSKEETAMRCLCCASGPITMTVTTDRSGYCSGESIAITVITENFSNRQLGSLQADLKQIVRYHGEPTTLHGRYVRNAYTRSKDVITSVSTVIQSIKGAPDWSNKLMCIPVIVPTISNSQIVQVAYTLDVFLEIHNASNLHTEIPIVIGTIPYKGPTAGMHTYR